MSIENAREQIRETAELLAGDNGLAFLGETLCLTWESQAVPLSLEGIPHDDDGWVSG